jgi:4-hydroxy-tetrahydrodipicolinate reductase
MSQITRIIMHGCNGHMGQVITGLAGEDDSLKIVAGVDVVDNRENGYPVFTSLADCQVEADVMIDFSSFKAADQVIDYCREKKLPLVLCTTGLTPDKLTRVQEASKETAILRSANMSLGINLLLKLLKEAAQILAPAGFDMEVEERHHKLKCDAPSGTALALADSLNEALGGAYHYTYDRSQRHQRRDPKEIGISALRGGTIVGEHDVLFAGADEVIEFKHTAHSKAVFGKGALEAARFLAGKGAGMYDMSDVIANR